MQPYPGQNGSAIVYSSTPGAGGVSGGVLTIVQDAMHGNFSVPQIVTGNDQVTTGNIDPSPQANRDAIVWLGWRAIDWINGGDYSSLFTGTVTIANAFQFASGGGWQLLSGSAGFVQNGATLYVVFGGSISIAGGMVITSTGTATQSGTWTKSGNGAYNVVRTSKITSSPVTLSPQNYDTVICQAGAGQILVNAPTGLPEGIQCRFCIPGTPNGTGTISQPGGPVGIDPVGSSGNHIAVLDTPGSYASSHAILETMLVGATMTWVNVSSGNGAA